jgi:hypothetical protein
MGVNEDTAVRRPRRKWLQLSLRTLLVLVTVLCVWFARQSYRARMQAQAIAAIEKLGGHVGFDYQLDPKTRTWKTAPSRLLPQWAIDLLGEDHFRRVAIVNFDDGSNPTSDDLSFLAGMTDLRELTLFNRTQIDDGALSHVKSMQQLEVLALEGTKVKGPGLIHLRPMRKMRGLTLSGTAVNDDALAHLDQMAQLEWLMLSGTRVTDAGLKHLAALSSLKLLELRDTQVTKEGVSKLQQTLPACKISY